MKGLIMHEDHLEEPAARLRGANLSDLQLVYQAGDQVKFLSSDSCGGFDPYFA